MPVEINDNHDRLKYLYMEAEPALAMFLDKRDFKLLKQLHKLWRACESGDEEGVQSTLKNLNKK